MKEVPYHRLKKGVFLIATPEIDTGFFFRAVVLLCEHNQTGSFGLVINKDLDLDLPEEIVDPHQLANPHIGIRAGGPVQTNQMMLLHTSSEAKHQVLQICEDVYLGGDLQFLQESVNDELGPSIYLCFGYAGWSTGQLEKEVLDQNWIVCPASTELVFQIPPEKLWSQLLRSMGGSYASLSMIPEDLSVN